MSRLRSFAFVAGALLLAACDPSPAPSAAPTTVSSSVAPNPIATLAPTASAEPAGQTLPTNASVRFHWFAYASKTHEPHKIWLEARDPKKPEALMLSYSPNAGASPPRQEVPAAAREGVAKALEASKIGAWKVAAPKAGTEAKWNYVLSVSWPREGLPPASHTTSWTDATETPELRAVRKALLDLGIAQFPDVAKAAPSP